MTRKLTEWPFENGQSEKGGPSDGCRGNAVANSVKTTDETIKQIKEELMKSATMKDGMKTGTMKDGMKSTTMKGG